MCVTNSRRLPSDMTPEEIVNLISTIITQLHAILFRAKRLISTFL